MQGYRQLGAGLLLNHPNQPVTHVPPGTSSSSLLAETPMYIAASSRAGCQGAQLVERGLGLL